MINKNIGDVIEEDIDLKALIKTFLRNKKSKPANSKNPYLQNGDIIFLGNTKLNSASEVLHRL